MTSFKEVIFTDSSYDKEEALATVTIKYGNREFVGHAKAAEADKDKANSFSGCRLAELKATKKAIKSSLTEMNKEYNTINEFVNNCLQTKKFDAGSDTAKVMFRQLNILNKKIAKGEAGLAFVQKQIDSFN